MKESIPTTELLESFEDLIVSLRKVDKLFLFHQIDKVQEIGGLKKEQCNP